VLRIVAVACACAVVWVAAASTVTEQARLPLSAVVPGAVVSQPFGCTSVQLEPFDPFCSTHHVHTGIDLAAPPGTPVFSATAGIVSAGYDAQGAGIFVAVALPGGVRILYCHLLLLAVATGDSVTSGERLGEVGSTGLSTGPHLHFQVQVDGRYVDPAAWLARVTL
jgi:murein DD-endopeptidase MepM/ murein hydrolase activator NlpD